MKATHFKAQKTFQLNFQKWHEKGAMLVRQLHAIIIYYF